MSDRGRAVLAERAVDYGVLDTCLNVRGVVDEAEAQQMMDKLLDGILGDHGVFIVNADLHEPRLGSDDGGAVWLSCSCGWRTEYAEDESFYDHIHPEEG